MGSARNRLKKMIKSEVRAEARRSKTKDPRNVTVPLVPITMDRTSTALPSPTLVPNGEWTAYLEGPSEDKKYTIIPISSLIPPQRNRDEPDDMFRQSDKVFVKGVSLRLTLVHAEGVRFEAEIFRNITRSLQPSSLANQPYVIERGSVLKQLPDKVLYEVVTKEELLGENHDVSKNRFLPRQLSATAGPFSCRRTGGGELVWRSTDGTSFMAKSSKSEGRAIGKANLTVDGVRRKVHGNRVRLSLKSGGLMRAYGAGGNTAFMAMSHRVIEIYWALDRYEQFNFSTENVAESQRPMELFLAFDAPKAVVTSTKKDMPSAAITAMDVELFYR